MNEPWYSEIESLVITLLISSLLPWLIVRFFDTDNNGRRFIRPYNEGWQTFLSWKAILVITPVIALFRYLMIKLSIGHAESALAEVVGTIVGIPITALVTDLVLRRSKARGLGGVFDGYSILLYAGRYPFLLLAWYGASCIIDVLFSW